MKDVTGAIKIPLSYAYSSDFNEMPYCRFKLFFWLLMEAVRNSNSEKTGLQPGQISHSHCFSRDVRTWFDPGRRRSRFSKYEHVENDLEILEERGWIERENKVGVGEVISICNGEAYQVESEGTEPAQDGREKLSGRIPKVTTHIEEKCRGAFIAT